jgi:hypothetical protein
MRQPMGEVPHARILSFSLPSRCWRFGRPARRRRCTGAPRRRKELVEAMRATDQ